MEQPDYKRIQSQMKIVPSEVILLLKLILRNKLTFLSSFFLLFLTLAYFGSNQTCYSSSVTFLVNSSNTSDLLWNKTQGSFDEKSLLTSPINQVAQIVFSDEMSNYLISK